MYDTSLQRQIPSFATGNNIHILFMETIYLCIIIFLYVQQYYVGQHDG
jgi:hypothetical protein